MARPYTSEHFGRMWKKTTVSSKDSIKLISPSPARNAPAPLIFCAAPPQPAGAGNGRPARQVPLNKSGERLRLDGNSKVSFDKDLWPPLINSKELIEHGRFLLASHTTKNESNTANWLKNYKSTTGLLNMCWRKSKTIAFMRSFLL